MVLHVAVDVVERQREGNASHASVFPPAGDIRVGVEYLTCHGVNFWLRDSRKSEFLPAPLCLFPRFAAELAEPALCLYGFFTVS